MAEMALGYGSEYQLLRALGHHRERFFQILRNSIASGGFDGPINWKDYPVDTKSLSLDGEYCDIECFKTESFYEELKKNWNKFWPVSGRNAQNWDGVFTIGDEWFFVEAKAHLSEIRSRHKKSEKSDGMISMSFQETIERLQASKEADEWLRSPYYQLANRLTFWWFLRKNGINAHIVNVYFLNGFEKPQVTRDLTKIIDNKLSVKTADEWEKAIEKELYHLGLDKDSLSGIVYEAFVDCLYPKE